MKKFLNIIILATIIVSFVSVNAQVIRTASEESGFQRYTSHVEMMDYLQKIQASTTDMKLGIYGKTIEGREIPYAVFSRPSITQPWEAMVSGKPVAMVAANIHGGERTLRESNLLLIRELATRGTEANRLLDDLVIIMVPSINPDGFEAKPRSTRGNSQGVDMNRDYMKLEQPALTQYIQNVMNTWHPHIFIDAHNGGSYPYNVCYQGPSHAAPDQRITALADHELFPFIDQKMEQSGYRSFYYSGGNARGWRGGGFDPRIGRNYGGMVNSVGVLFESPGGQDPEIGAKSGKVACLAVLQWTAQNAEKVMMYVNRARRETIEMGDAAEGDVPIEMRYAAEDFKVDYEYNSAPRGQERVMEKVTGGSILKKPVITKTRPRPYAYVLEAKAHKAVKMLQRHGITIEVLQEDTELPVHAYIMEEISRRAEYDHPAAATVKLKETVVDTVLTFLKGTYVIPTGQMMGRVVSHLLEPETNDNVIRWNTMDAILPRVYTPEQLERMSRYRGRMNIGPPLIPIYKLMRPTPIATMILEY
ncbi:MAG: hypothetical protein GY863_01800 [bacterium]|nr:hypothetical protein [bacterium]